MAAPLPVHRNPAYVEDPSASRHCVEAALETSRHEQAATDSCSEDDPGVRSGMILSLVQKKPISNLEVATDLASLQEENRRLRASLDQARERLTQMERELARWRQREQEYEALLEEKSELIRQLHQELQLAKERPTRERRVPREEELIALEQELLREREQLKRDEEQLMAEIRQMEVTLSRERADLARQRNELQRLHQQIQTELEMASREAALRERLRPLYELHAELQRRYFGEARTSRRPPSSYQLPNAPSSAKSSPSSNELAPTKFAPPLGSSPTAPPASSRSSFGEVNPSAHPSAQPPPATPDSKHAPNDDAKPGFFRRLFGLA
ncbi:MAG: hypothetical protein RMJ19_01990 [Gemmatales bacterium]|nr:hypothetical protein [Gemmatales bacterium]MDW8174417.1 hypothetical protein [Gemmatales bacterium]